MKAFAALVRREFIEHRGAFFIAPAIIVGLIALVTALSLLTGNLEVRSFGLTRATPVRVFEAAFVALSLAWWLYLVGAVFFYSADAFSADRRDNAMLFWKSMPQSDLRILFSKYAAATVLLPLLVYAAMLITGMIAYLMVLALNFTAADLMGLAGQALGAYWGIAVSILVALVLSVLWYAPFLAWVGMLSTIAGRWSVPLSVLVPALAALVENIVTRGNAPGGGYIWSYFQARMGFPLMAEGDLESWLFGFGAFDSAGFVTELLARIDWLQVLIGLAFVPVAILVASEVRRRSLGK